MAAGTSLWRHRDFRRYPTGRPASVAGSSITQMALPVLAVLHLDATTAEVAWLAFLGQLPPALLALHAGALADRYSKRRQMITGDLVSAGTLTLVNATTSFALGLLNTLWAIYLLRSLAMGAAAGALTAPALARRYGPGPMTLAALAITPLIQLPLLLASPGRAWQITIGAALFLQLACAGAAGTAQRSIRQIVTTAGMQARMQAVSTWLTSGARPVAALLAGALGRWIDVRPALTAGTFLLLVPLVVLARSPIRVLRQMPDPPATALPSPLTARTSPPAVPTPARTDDARHGPSLGGDTP